MMPRIKKTKTNSNNENSNKTVVQKIKNSNSKTNHLKEISNKFNMKNVSENQFDRKKSKKRNKRKTPSTSSKIKTVETEEKQRTAKKNEEELLNIIDTDDNRPILNKSPFFKGSGNNGTKKVTFNETQNNIQSNSISHFKGLSNSIDASENQFERKKSKKRNTPSTSSKIKTVGTEEEQDNAEKILEESSNLTNTEDNKPILTESAKHKMVDNMNNYSVSLECISISQNIKMKTVKPEEKQGTCETTIYDSSNLSNKNEGIPATESVVFKGSEYRKSKKFTFNENQNKAQSYSKIHNKDISNNIDMKGLEKEHFTAETNIENSSNLLDTDSNESIFNESVKLEMEYCRPSCIVHAYYQDSLDSDCQYKRKLSELLDDIQNILKRFKHS